MECEVDAVAEIHPELEWLRFFFVELRLLHLDSFPPFIVQEDNRSAISFLESEWANDKAKHIAARYHKVRVAVHRDAFMTLAFCGTDEMGADFLTKNVFPVQLENLLPLTMGPQDLSTVLGCSK
jgi:hypothetical protein